MISLGYPPSGDQPAKIHRIKPAPTSTTTPESANLPEIALARLVSTEESKLEGMDDMASSTTPSTTIGSISIHKTQKNIIDNENQITIRVAETATNSPSISLDNRLDPSNNTNNCQNYQHLVGILSTPPIAQNSLIMAVAADAMAATQEQHEEVKNKQNQFSPTHLEHVPSIPWSRPQSYHEGNNL